MAEIASAVAAGIFCARNVDKAENQGRIGRWVPAGGQLANVTKYVSSLDNKVGKGTQEAVNIFRKAAQNEKLLDYAGKAVNFASKHVNHFLVASAGIDILMADDKEEAIVTNTTALGSMFAVEKLMKEHLKDIPKMERMKGISEKVMKFAKENKCEGKLPGIIHGVAFVLGSCTAYGAGEQLGKFILGKSDKS